MFIRSKSLGHYGRIFPLSLGAFLVFLGAFVVCSNVDFSESVEATDVSSKFTVSLNDVLTISSPSSIILDNCNPSTASLCTASATVNVSTNNLTGYSLYLNATSGSSNSLTNTAVTPNPTIPTLNNQYSSANFPVNSWGYTGGTDQSGNSGYNCSTNYCPILAYEADPEDYSPNHLIKETSAPATTSNTNLTFAAKANTSKASGTYTTSVTFTAVANEVPAQPIHDGMNMQDIDADVCNATPLYSVSNTTYTVVDSRNHTNYTVAKLEDGNCWMTQNLALGSSSPTVLTQADSNVGPSGFTLPASVAEGNWDSSYTDPEFFDYAGNYPSQQASNRYGNYYNYSAATAGSDTGVAYEDVPYDICPKGWRLPSGNEYQALINDYPELSTEAPTTLDFAPLWIVAPGDYNSGIYGQDVRGSWWSSTAGSAGTSYGEAKFLSIHLYDMSPSEVVSGGRDSGQSVRCIVNKPVINNGMYMQDVTQEQIAYTPTDVTYTLKDKRDETEYTVAKLQDGNLWMTQNLALGGSTAMNLTQTNSNVGPSGFTLPASVAEGNWSASATNPEFFDYAGNYPSQQATNKYGNYYNWNAATAGSGTNIENEDAPYDICPKNWRLPSAGSSYTNSEQYNMIRHYINSGTWDDSDPPWLYWDSVTTTDFTNTPVSLVFSGLYFSGDVSEQGDFDHWWSATAGDSYGAYGLSADSGGSVYPRISYDKLGGDSIRCLVPGA